MKKIVVLCVIFSLVGLSACQKQSSSEDAIMFDGMMPKETGQQGSVSK